MPLSGQVVLVTGAARRIGAAVARAFHAAGAAVALHYHRSAKEGARWSRSSMRRGRNPRELIRGDLALPDAWTALPATAIRAFGRLDVLVNNASTFYPTPVGEITIAQFDDLIGTNLRAPLFLAQAAAPELRRRRD